MLNGFDQVIHPTQGFKLTTFAKANTKGSPLVVYLEGDGHSMQSRYRLSNDPTPHQPLALELAMLDERPNVVYIARPCQYTPVESDSLCHQKYWSTHRFASEVIESTNQLIDDYKTQLKPSAIHLVGFSGGGGLSILVASHRTDVESVTTVAGDLDLELMTTLHHTTPQYGSLNPLQFAARLKAKQLHLSGEKDTVVPPMIAKSYLKQSNGACISHRVMPNFSHHHGWKENWPQLLSLMPCIDET